MIEIKPKKLANEFKALVYKCGARWYEHMGKQSKMDRLHQLIGDLIAGKSGATAEVPELKQTLNKVAAKWRAKAKELQSR